MTISDLGDPRGRDMCHFQTKAPEARGSDPRLEDAGARDWGSESKLKGEMPTDMKSTYSGS